MALFFCLRDVLDALEKAVKAPFDALGRVSVTRPECGGFPEDAFLLHPAPSLLNLDQDRAALDLAALIEDVPLYRLNMELTLDQALAARHQNARIKKALEAAFRDEDLPNTLQTDRVQDTLYGGLRHPVLGHMSRLQLSEIYLGFLEALGPASVDHGFVRDILRGQAPRLFDHYDGYVRGGKGAVRVATLLATGTRTDQIKHETVEKSWDSGLAEAQTKDVEDRYELLWAWLEEDHFQMRRLRDIDWVMAWPDMSPAPGWVKGDVMAILAKEAGKHVYAAKMVAKDPELALLKNAPALQQAIRDNSAREVSPLLRRLLEQTLSNESYKGVAGEAADKAQVRQDEARQVLPGGRA